jgi:hypothetical protein
MFQKRLINIFLLLLFFILVRVAGYTQPTDTLFVYETVYITDTVWIEPAQKRDTTHICLLNSIKETTLLIDTFSNNATLVCFSNEKNATIPINRIYINRNQLNQTKMKKASCFTLLFLAIQSITFSQSFMDKNVYNIGIGIGNENNVSNYGILFTNDYRIYMSKRIALNPRIGFFQSIGSLEPADQFGYRSHSGIMFDFGLSYSFFMQIHTNLSINFGPSWELGSETYLASAEILDDVFVNQKFENNTLSRIGFYFDIDFTFWQNQNISHTLGLKTNYFSFYPEVVGIVYKIGFNQKKN